MIVKRYSRPLDYVLSVIRDGICALDVAFAAIPAMRQQKRDVPDVPSFILNPVINYFFAFAFTYAATCWASICVRLALGAMTFRIASQRGSVNAVKGFMA